MITVRAKRLLRPSFFQIMQERQTYSNILYLLLSFPLGVGYFVFLITGIMLGLGTLIIWIGVPILVLMMSAWWQLAVFERYLAIRWLNISIAPLSYSPLQPLTNWARVQQHLANAMTWRTLVFLLLKFVVGILSFVITLPLLALTLGVTPALAIIGLLTAPCFLLFQLIRREADGDTGIVDYLLFACLGFGLVPATLYILNGMAFVVGELARTMLGMSESALRLQEANARAEQAKIQAEQADLRRRELVVNVSHELRTPVASIAGHVESLLLSTEEGRVAPPPDTLYNYLSIVHHEVERLGMLVDDLLSLARAETGELRLKITDVAASEVIEEVYHALMPMAQRERRVTLVRGGAPHLPLVRADRQRLAQVLLNLVRNAITSTPPGGIVEMSIEQPDPSHLAFIVADNGIGIAEADLAHIFERFYRADNSRSRASGGFGLGLAIVHELVTAMGGSISVTSEVGRGSRFTVLLPCSQTNQTTSVSKSNSSRL